jgi:hypothetical protein
MTSPALGLEVVGMDVIALADGSDDATYVLTVFDDRCADREVAKRDLVADRHILVVYGVQLAVILGHHAQQSGAGGEILNHHDPDVVTVIVY